MSAEEALLPGDGWISDDSSFYGDEETKADLEEQSACFSIRPYWSVHDQLLSTVVQRARAATSKAKPKIEDVELKEHEEVAIEEERITPNLPNWYQPTETVDEFLKRMSPLDTVLEHTGFSWLWVQSPKSSAYNKEQPDIDAFCAQGGELLESYLKKKAEIERDNPSIAKGSVTRKLTKDRIKLKEDIERLMVQEHVTGGKWLLRPSLVDAPRFWKQVCLGVLDGRLGNTAKIATTCLAKPEEIRMICVYTKDCFDIEDMQRVLLALTDMGLVTKEQQIYYKTDAYTYLDIYSDNEYKLGASLYSSTNIWNHTAKKRKAEAPPSQPSTWKGKKPAFKSHFTKG
ncbi:hypothetical protein HDK77DRAFT_300251 [Phyllosticta capitalensis]